jgi:hypothetical protein
MEGANPALLRIGMMMAYSCHNPLLSRKISSCSSVVVAENRLSEAGTETGGGRNG